MKVSYYCQHVLGIGHFHRSLEICRAIARHHQTTLILGGPPVVVAEPGINVVKLPGLQMDTTFNNMTPCQRDRSLEEVKTERTSLLFNHFKQYRPDIFITELYPFGRKAFKFELEPILVALQNGSLPQCSCYSSVRDILVEKASGREKFEQRVVQTLNTFFDGVLVHADPEVVTLNETFGRLNDVIIPVHYTGFVTKTVPHPVSIEVRKRLGLQEEDKLIVASIGGGNVGYELLYSVIDAFEILTDSTSAHLQLFCGPYCDEKVYNDLQQKRRDSITIDLFTDNFPGWLKAADLSVSMAGYNTSMNLLQAGIPSLVYPFKQNREQRLRAEKLSSNVPLSVLEESDLTPENLAIIMSKQLQQPKYITKINLDGAKETVRQLQNWNREHCHHD